MKLDKDEKMIIKYKGSPLSTLLRCQYPPWMGPTNGATLIPRSATRIMVFGIWDIRMNVQRAERPRTAPINNHTDQGSHDRGLHEAARRGDLTMARNVVARTSGVELVSSQDSRENLPLHLAVVNGHTDMVNYLLEKYPQGSYLLNKEKKSPLYIAVESCRIDLVDCMLGACVNDARLVTMLNQAKPIVHLAITRQNLEMVNTILKHCPELIKSKDEEGQTPLSYAAFKGHLNMVQQLVNEFPKSISYQNKDQNGSYPVHKACLGGDVEVLEIFHSSSSKSLFREDKYGRNILHLAAKERGNKLKNVVSYLLSLATNDDTIRKSFNKEDEYGNKPLALAKLNKNEEIAQLLDAARMH